MKAEKGIEMFRKAGNERAGVIKLSGKKAAINIPDEAGKGQQGDRSLF